MKLVRFLRKQDVPALTGAAHTLEHLCFMVSPTHPLVPVSANSL